MIYTLGRHTAYENNFKKISNLQKLGRCEGYEGGSVFQTAEEVWEYIVAESLEGYSVYGVEADWERDTEKSQTNVWNDLLRDAPLVQLNHEVFSKPYKKHL